MEDPPAEDGQQPDLLGLRARRRRTIPAEQLRLALGGDLDHVWAVSFIVTDIPSNAADLVGLEAWFRARVSIEETIPGIQTRRWSASPTLR